MELELKRETLRFERLVNRGEGQVTIEGEAALQGSMRDAVTVLSVQAQAHLNDTQAGSGEVGVRGRVNFQVLYTQGDLTRIRALETNCDFTHTLPLPGVTPGMRIGAAVSVLDTEGAAASGRISLSASLAISLEAFEAIERELIADVTGDEETGLQKKMQHEAYCIGETLGTGKALAREEYDLPDRLGVSDVLSATATPTTAEVSGGSGRTSISGVIEVRVLHRPKVNGDALVTTVHELPYEVGVDAKIPEGVQPMAVAEVTDVMADSIEGDRGRTLRAEAEVKVTLGLCRQQEAQWLEDVYSLSGPALEPEREEMEIHTFEEAADVRESLRLQATLPENAPPIGRMLAAFAQPMMTAAAPAGKRLQTEGVMNVTLIYLPLDSDIPYAVHTREPFVMTFPVEADAGVTARMYPIETTPGPTTSDRAEIRCVLGLHAVQHGTQLIHVVTAVEQKPQEKQEHGFVLVWPREGESRWETARRLRVRQDALMPAGKGALLALRR